MTTVSSTTYSTTTTITATMPFDICPTCPKNDTMIEPRFIIYSPQKIRSGRYEDCQDQCKAMGEDQCRFFNFYTEAYEGELKNYCVLFRDELHNNEERLPMKGRVTKANCVQSNFSLQS